MKEIKSFLSIGLATLLICWSSYVIYERIHKKYEGLGVVTDTNYGKFLASQHALYINDFDSAQKFIADVNVDNSYVKNVKNMASFFNGQMPENADSLKGAKEISSRLIYDAYLIQNNKWKELYKVHEKDKSVLFASIRIFATAKQGKTKEALKFIDSLDTADSWKAFLRGQIAVLNNDIKKAALEFADVHPDFMNINDYLYLMSFYRENNMTEDMDILRNDFTDKAGGMFVLDYPEIPDWSNYSGYKNNILFSVIQTVSHTQIMLFTDLSLMLLRFGQVISDGSNADALNYYLGQYYSFNNGDYKSSFDKVSYKHPLYLFGQMKIAEKTKDIKAIKKIAEKNPLFIPATNIIVNYYIRNGEKRHALRILNRALKQKNLTDSARVYFLKKRANVYLMFEEPKKAQKDVDAVMEIDDRLLNDILMLRARIWVQLNENLDQANTYAMMLVQRNTSSIAAWDLLGTVVEKNEGVDAALGVLKRVGEIASNTSSLYEHLGDFYMKKGDKEKARASYLRAIELSDDGLIVLPRVQKKLRKAK